MGARQIHHAHPGRDEGGAALRAGQEGADLGGVAGVVQEDQDAAAVQDRAVERRALFQGVGDGGVRRAQGAQERAEDRLRLRRPLTRTLQVDVQLPVGERRARLVGHVHGEGRLADAADARERRDGHDLALALGGGGGGQDVAQFLDEGRAAREVRDRGGELGGADRCRGGLGGRGRGFREARVGLEDALLELLQARARVHAEFVGEEAARVGVHGERLGLPPAAVQGEHQQFAQPLAQGVRRGQGGEFGDGLRVAALLQVHVEAGFEELEAPLLQAGALCLRVRPGHARQRLPVPQAQRPVQQVAGGAQVSGVLGLLGVGGEFLGLGEVEGAIAAGQPDRVTAGLADQDAGVQGLAEPGGVRPYGGQRLGRRLLTPQGVDQLAGRGRPALPQQQRGQQGALLRGPRGQGILAAPGAHRAEHAEAQRRRFPGTSLLRHSRYTVHRRPPAEPSVLRGQFALFMADASAMRDSDHRRAHGTGTGDHRALTTSAYISARSRPFRRRAAAPRRRTGQVADG